MKKGIIFILTAAFILGTACDRTPAAVYSEPEGDFEILSALQERFLRYVAIDTQSDPDAEISPSVSKEIEFARLLAEECKRIGLTNVALDRYGIVTAILPANIDNDLPVVGFISHMDTAPDAPGAGVVPQVFANYDGGDLVLGHGTVLSPSQFPALNNYIGQTIITASGDTLLGADDKAGIAIIMTAMEYLIRNPEIPRREIHIAFTPDEEIGLGMDFFDIEAFNADFAFTVDGGFLGELSFENFNAAFAHFEITGFNVHPGHAKDIMVNSALIAMELALSLPADERPENTDGYDGFFFIQDIQGGVARTTMDMLIRTFDTDDLQHRKNLVINLVDTFNQRYGENTVKLNLRDQYSNMREMIAPWIVEYAVNAYHKAGVEPIIIPTRGGTDGSWLSEMGLPTPNIFTGGYNFHGLHEFIPLESMEKAVAVVVNLAGMD